MLTRDFLQVSFISKFDNQALYCKIWQVFKLFNWETCCLLKLCHIRTRWDPFHIKKENKKGAKKVWKIAQETTLVT